MLKLGRNLQGEKQLLQCLLCTIFYSVKKWSFAMNFTYLLNDQKLVSFAMNAYHCNLHVSTVAIWPPWETEMIEKKEFYGFKWGFKRPKLFVRLESNRNRWGLKKGQKIKAWDLLSGASLFFLLSSFLASQDSSWKLHLNVNMLLHRLKSKMKQFQAHLGELLSQSVGNWAPGKSICTKKHDILQ